MIAIPRLLRALVMRSGDAYVSAGDAPTGGLTALTVEAWARVDARAGGNQPVVWKRGGDGQEWALYVTLDGRVYFQVYHAGGMSVAHSPANALPVGTWRHLAGCFDGSSISVWVDGANKTQYALATDAAVANTGQAVRIGGNLGAGFVGRVGWCRISDVVRYAAPFSVRPVSYPTVDAHTLAQWNVSEGSGSTLENAEGTSDYDGSIVGAKWGWMVV